MAALRGCVCTRISTMQYVLYRTCSSIDYLVRSHTDATLDVAGFMQINHNGHLGGIWFHYSETNGHNGVSKMQWKLFDGKMVALSEGSGITKQWGTILRRFFTRPISKKAPILRWRETFKDTVVDHSWAQMGSGAPASKGYGVAAFQIRPSISLATRMVE